MVICMDTGFCVYIYIYTHVTIKLLNHFEKKKFCGLGRLSKMSNEKKHTESLKMHNRSCLLQDFQVSSFSFSFGLLLLEYCWGHQLLML